MAVVLTMEPIPTVNRWAAASSSCVAVQAPIAIIRGAWDGLVQDADARWLFDAFSRSTEKFDIKIAGGTHLLLFEEMRGALWNSSIHFLMGDKSFEHVTLGALTALPEGGKSLRIPINLTRPDGRRLAAKGACDFMHSAASRRSPRCAGQLER